jgi:hypothetical protein
MPSHLVTERLKLLRQEIAEISEANQRYLEGGRKLAGAEGDQQRRAERLQAIMDELLALTDWKKL